MGTLNWQLRHDGNHFSLELIGDGGAILWYKRLDGMERAINGMRRLEEQGCQVEIHSSVERALTHPITHLETVSSDF